MLVLVHIKLNASLHSSYRCLCSNEMSKYICVIVFSLNVIILPLPSITVTVQALNLQWTLQNSNR